MNTAPAELISPLGRIIMEKLNRLGSAHVVRFGFEHYDPNRFGGETAVKVQVDRMILEISVRDPNMPFEIELSCCDTKAWGRASYVRNFLTHGNDYNERRLLDGLLDWLIGNFEAACQLICAAAEDHSFAEYAKTLDEVRANEAIRKFKRQN